MDSFLLLFILLLGMAEGPCHAARQKKPQHPSDKNALGLAGDNIEVKKLVDKPQGEFWGYQKEGNYDIKDCSSAAHVYGKQIASGAHVWCPQDGQPLAETIAEAGLRPDVEAPVGAALYAVHRVTDRRRCSPWQVDVTLPHLVVLIVGQ